MNNTACYEPIATYEEAVRWINSLIPFGIKPGLKRMDALMDRLGAPHRRLKFIHVAGTNGKGSTCAFLTRALMECGYRVGTFTSPYIEKFTNRIQVNREDIPEEEILRLANRVKPLVAEIAATELGSPSVFEVITTISLLYFAETACPDFIVWETGLGGRLDSTNIVSPLLSVITNVGFDHMDVLGETIQEISAEKAGIIKPGVPVVTAVENEAALAVIEQTAAERKASLYRLHREYRIESEQSKENEQSFDFSSPFQSLHSMLISLNGAHQVKNACVALMALELLRQYYAADIGEEAVRRAFLQTEWPGRLEMIGQSPRLLIDGAHNPEGAEALVQALKETYSYKRLHFMIGMVSTKNHLAYLKHILPIADSVILTEADFHKKLDTDILADKAVQALGELNLPKAPSLTVEPDWKKALALLLETAEGEDLAVVTGTLYLISDVRSWVIYHSDSEKGW